MSRCPSPADFYHLDHVIDHVRRDLRLELWMLPDADLLHRVGLPGAMLGKGERRNVIETLIDREVPRLWLDKRLSQLSAQ